MNFGVSLSILLVAICSCKGTVITLFNDHENFFIYTSDAAVRIRFRELDYSANEGDAMATVVLVVSESSSQPVTIPIIVMSFDEFFRVRNRTLPNSFDTVDLPDEAECEHLLTCSLLSI